MSSLAKLAHAPAASRCTHTLVAAALRRVGSTSASTSSPAAPRGRIVVGRHHHHHLGIRRQHRLVRTAAAADVDTDAILASYLDDAQMNQVRTFAATLLEKNKVMNLTGAATIDEVLTRHVADSLALLPAIERALGPDVSAANAKIRVMDVGSGAGFPGIALAIARPAWEVTLLDTLQKRTSFLDAAAAECGATNVRTLWSRAEDAGKVGSEHREAYDVVTARAVAELRILAELCVPLVKVEWRFRRDEEFTRVDGNGNRGCVECDRCPGRYPARVGGGAERGAGRCVEDRGGEREDAGDAGKVPPARRNAEQTTSLRLPT